MPAYTFPADREDLSVLRIVCRNGFSHDLAEVFLTHLRAAVDELDAEARTETMSGAAGFRH